MRSTIRAQGRGRGSGSRRPGGGSKPRGDPRPGKLTGVTSSLPRRTAMPVVARPDTPSKPAFIVGWVVSALPALFLFTDAVTKLMQLPAVVEATAKLGYAPEVIVPLGIVLLHLHDPVPALADQRLRRDPADRLPGRGGGNARPHRPRGVRGVLSRRAGRAALDRAVPPRASPPRARPAAAMARGRVGLTSLPHRVAVSGGREGLTPPGGPGYSRGVSPASRGGAHPGTFRNQAAVMEELSDQGNELEAARRDAVPLRGRDVSGHFTVNGRGTPV